MKLGTEFTKEMFSTIETSVKIVEVVPLRAFGEGMGHKFSLFDLEEKPLK